MKYGNRAITVGVGLKTDNFIEMKDSLAELDELVGAIGSEVVGSVVQRVTQWTPATLIGSGKIEELKQLAEDSGAQMVVIDHILTGSQGRNLSEELKVPVIDRTQLIIEIFAQRAQSHEGKLQVELAQMLDQYSRMVGAWHGSLSRLGGGIGTRGPGEKAIEMDRRTIRKRIARIRHELENTRQHRALHRVARRRNDVPSFALIGYTNAGKSTLLRQLTHSQVLVADQVFATLDPTTRKVFLPDAPNAVITDTVGFIRKLPTQLVEAFKATLEETAEADILIHVIDFSSPEWESQMQTVEKLIDEFGWRNKTILYAFNKVDKASTERRFKVDIHPRAFVSALTGEGLDELKELMIRALHSMTQKCELYFDNSQRHLIFELGREAKIIKQEDGTRGVILEALLTPTLKSRWKEHLT